MTMTTAKQRCRPPAAWNPPTRFESDLRPLALGEEQRQPREREPEEARHEEDVEPAVEVVEPPDVGVRGRSGGPVVLHRASPFPPRRSASRRALTDRGNHSAVWTPKKAKTPIRRYFMKRAVNQRTPLRPLSCGFACGSYFANFGPAPGWHFWQVASRFAGPTDDRDVARRVDLVRRVAVRARRDRREAELRDLAVVRVAVALERRVVAAAALLEDRQAPHLGRRRDRVGRVAVGADGDALVALRELLAVDRRRVLVEDLRVARAARRRHVGARDGALRVALRAADLVVPVAGRAVRGDLQARFLERLAVDRVVEAHRLAAVGPARAREDLRIAVAAHARRRQVEVVRPRRRVLRGLDVVGAVAVGAPGGLARGLFARAAACQLLP